MIYQKLSGLVLATCMWGSICYADVVVTVTPNTAIANTQINQQHAVTWKVVVTPSSTVTTDVTISSPTLMFHTHADQTQGQAFAQVSKTLLKTSAVITGGFDVTATFSESISLAAEVTRKAKQLGLSKYYVFREFSCTYIDTSVSASPLPCTTSGSAVEVAKIAALVTESSAASALTISTEPLRVNVPKVVPQHHKANAHMLLNCTGSGAYRYWWEIRKHPITKYNKPASWKKTSKHASACRDLLLTSPDLPTDLVGRYAVQLKFEKPSTLTIGPSQSTSPARFTYRVVAPKPKPVEVDPSQPTTKQPSAIAKIKTIKGLKATYVHQIPNDEDFSWLPIDGANTYLVSLYSMLNEQTRRILAVKTNKNNLELASYQRLRLEPFLTTNLLWQVQAMDKRGRILGLSKLTEWVPVSNTNKAKAD